MKATAAETMVSVCSRFIKNGETVFVGVGIPLLASMCALRTHAPNTTILFEGGGVGPRSNRIPWTISDNPTTEKALMSTETWRLFSDTQRGFIDSGILGAAQIDRYGNINTSVLTSGGDFSYEHPKVRLPGSGGGNDIATLCRKHIVVCTMDKGRFVEKVDYITSPGYLRGGNSRLEAGIRWGGPEAIVTDQGVFRFETDTKEMILTGIYADSSLEQIKASVPWELAIAERLEVYEVQDEEISLIRSLDPLNIFLGSKSVSTVEDFETFYQLMARGSE